MRPALKVLAWSLATFVVVLAAVFGDVAYSEWQMDKTFERLSSGASQDAVLDQFGEPTSRSSDCYIAQFIEYEAPVGWSTQSKASNCAHWFGVSMKSYVVGFDAAGKVVGVAYGDS
jgi:hypothetical protein